jgi:hypothetical protein
MKYSAFLNSWWRVPKWLSEFWIQRKSIYATEFFKQKETFLPREERVLNL